MLCCVQCAQYVVLYHAVLCAVHPVRSTVSYVLWAQCAVIYDVCCVMCTHYVVLYHMCCVPIVWRSVMIVVYNVYVYCTLKMSVFSVQISVCGIVFTIQTSTSIIFSIQYAYLTLHCTVHCSVLCTLPGPSLYPIQQCTNISK